MGLTCRQETLRTQSPLGPANTCAQYLNELPLASLLLPDDATGTAQARPIDFRSGTAHRLGGLRPSTRPQTQTPTRQAAGGKTRLSLRPLTLAWPTPVETPQVGQTIKSSPATDDPTHGALLQQWACDAAASYALLPDGRQRLLPLGSVAVSERPGVCNGSRLRCTKTCFDLTLGPCGSRDSHTLTWACITPSPSTVLLPSRCEVHLSRL